MDHLPMRALRRHIGRYRGTSFRMGFRGGRVRRNAPAGANWKRNRRVHAGFARFPIRTARPPRR